MRVELRDGQWAELRERITHAQDKTLNRAWRAGKADPMVVDEIDTVLVRVFVSSWHVLDPAGAAIPLDDPDAVDRAPSDIVDKLAVEAAQIWTAATVPNPPTPPSSGSSSSTDQ